jgi:hypothetical protein
MTLRQFCELAALRGQQGRRHVPKGTVRPVSQAEIHSFATNSGTAVNRSATSP